MLAMLCCAALQALAERLCAAPSPPTLQLQRSSAPAPPPDLAGSQWGSAPAPALREASRNEPPGSWDCSVAFASASLFLVGGEAAEGAASSTLGGCLFAHQVGSAAAPAVGPGGEPCGEGQGVQLEVQWSPDRAAAPALLHDSWRRLSLKLQSAAEASEGARGRGWRPGPGRRAWPLLCWVRLQAACCGAGLRASAHARIASAVHRESRCSVVWQRLAQWERRRIQAGGRAHSLHTHLSPACAEQGRWESDTLEAFTFRQQCLQSSPLYARLSAPALEASLTPPALAALANFADGLLALAPQPPPEQQEGAGPQQQQQQQPGSGGSGDSGDACANSGGGVQVALEVEANAAVRLLSQLEPWHDRPDPGAQLFCAHAAGVQLLTVANLGGVPGGGALVLAVDGCDLRSGPYGSGTGGGGSGGPCLLHRPAGARLDGRAVPGLEVVHLAR